MSTTKPKAKPTVVEARPAPAKSKEKTKVQIINSEISRELSDAATSRALLATTFKGLSELKMKQAIMEGMLRGFTFQNFLQKDVYAIKFGDGYALVTSIDYARKLGMRGGVNGKSAPVYEEDAQGKIKSCSVTVYTKDGHPNGYTATVYFNEYSTGKQQWQSRPRTMIAKVAEMHALRMACPEEVSKIYISDEMEQPEKKSRDKDVVAVQPVDDHKWRNKLGQFLKDNPEVSKDIDYSDSLETEELAQSTYTKLLSEITN